MGVEREGARTGPRPPPDPFTRNLAWSALAHFAALGAVAFAYAADSGPALPPPSAMFVELGMSGPSPTPSLGAPAPAPEPVPIPEPEPAPEPEPEPEPPAPEPPPPEPEPEARPDVVRPTNEARDRMPTPEARTRRREPRPEQPDSGLRGRDAAAAPAGRLATRRPVDTSSRPSRRRPADGASGSGSGGIGLGGVPGGSLFDQDFEYAYYQRQMIARIQANWQRIPVRGEARVVIRFTIHRNGSISAAGVESSSGQDLLDRAALRAVILGEPFPQLPDSFPRDQVGVHLLFTYEGGTAGGLPFGSVPGMGTGT